MSDVGYATLPIIPSVRGAGRSIEQQLNGQMGTAGASAGTLFGRTFGRAAAKSTAASQIAASLKTAVAKATVDSVKANNAIQAASGRILAARRSEATAAGLVRVAELKLIETRAKEGVSASAIAAAEERLAAAQRTAAAAGVATAEAQQAYAAATARATQASNALAGASARLAAVQRDVAVASNEAAAANARSASGAGKLGSSISSAGGTLAGFARKAGLFTGAVVAIAVGIAAFGIKASADLETTQTAFTSLLGSATLAAQQIKELQAYAAKTPFKQQDVFGYAQQFYALAGSIGLAKSQVIPFLDVIGNIGAVTGASTEGIHNAVLAIGQIGAYGKVTLDNIRQIANAFPGFNAIEAIAKGTGQTTKQVLTEINRGALDAKTGIQALLKGMQDFPGAAGAMQKQALTLKGVWSTFTDTIRIKLTQAFVPVIPVVKQTLTQITPIIASTLTTLAPVIAQFMTSLQPLIGPLIQSLGQIIASVLGALGPVLKTLAPLIQPITAALVQMVQALAPLFTFAAQILAQIGPPLLAMFSQLLVALQPVVQELVAALGPVLPVIAQALGQLFAALQPVIGALAGAFIQVIKAIAPSLPQLAQAFGNLALALADLLVALSPLIPIAAKWASLVSVAFVKTVTVLANAFAKLVEWVAKLVTAGGHLIGNVLNRLGPVFKVVEASILPVVLLFERLADAYETVKGVIGNVDAGLNVLSGVTGDLAGNGEAANIATEKLAGGITAIGRAAGEAAGAMASLNDQIAQQAGAALGGAAGDVAKGATSGLGLGVIKAPTVPGKKKPAFDKGTLTAFLNTVGITQNPLTIALNAIFDSAKAAGKHLSSAFIAQITAENNRLKGLVKARDEVAKKLAAAQAKLQAVQAQYSNEKSSVSTAFKNSVNLGTAGTGFDGKQPVTASNILAQVRQAVNRSKRFLAILKNLKKRGFPAGLLDQMAQVGVDALPEAEALNSASASTLNDIKAQFKTLDSTSNSIGKFMADDMYGAGVNSAKGLVKGLQSQESALTKAIKGLAEKMVAQLRSTLGIHSPSTVTRLLGQFTGRGFALGIGDTEDHVATAAKGLANKGMPKSQVDAWQARHGGTPSSDGSAQYVTRDELAALVEAWEAKPNVFKVGAEEFATTVEKTRRYSRHNIGG